MPVITGFGVVSAIGTGAEDFWLGVQAGKTGARPVRSFDTSQLRNRIGCEVAEADSASGLPRASRLATLAAREALASAGLAPDEPDEVEGVCVGTTMGDLPEIETQLASSAPEDRERVAEILSQSFGARIGAALGIAGPHMTVATSCSAGNIAICRAADLIRSRSRTRLLAGGADAFSKLAFIGFSRMRAMAPERCTPFSQGRKGMLLGEGAAFLVVESLRSARERGATIHAAILGYGLSCDAHHIANPDNSGRGAARAMALALKSANLRPEQVDYVSAHGTGTPANDLAESRACRSVFAERQPPISSLKALIGHSLGAASALEAVASLLSLRDQRLIPAWNLDQQDPDCPVNLPRPDGSARTRLDVILSNAFAFGGNNSCLALARHP